MNQKDIRTFRQLLMAWYAENKREFPWRKETPEPFVTLVSEVMLQQTQTSRVAEKLPVFLEKYPTIQRLAVASNSEVIRAWQGMGYNSRALRLRDCARSIVDKYDGEVPSTKHELLELIGIGNYTSSALLAFCFKQNVAVVDVNIRRVYSRIASKMTTTSMLLPVKEIDELAEMVFPRGESSAWHQAVMDIGASFCTARKPKCRECPLNSVCLSSGEMVDVPPVKRAEPSCYGVPRRIWRGRIVELLRSTHGAISVQEITNHLFGFAATTDDTDWIHSLIIQLEKEGICSLYCGNIRLSEG